MPTTSLLASLCLAFAVLMTLGLNGPPLQAADSVSEYYVYVGTYTRGGKSKGIYILKMNMKTGELTPSGVAEGIANPSFLEIHPSGNYLYSVGEIADFEGKNAGGVHAFKINKKDGSLKLINQQSSVGSGPCHLTVDSTGKNVLVANYGGGSVACLPIKSDGSLEEASSFIQHEGSSVNPGRQKGPHAHSINLSPDNRFAVAADLGLDKVLVYKFDAGTGNLTSNDPAFTKVKPGAGPRHFHFHPSGKFAYLINEMSLTVNAFSYNTDKGELTTIQTISTIPDSDRGQSGLSTAEVRVHPSGKFLYGSNRGHDTIVAYRINQDTGKLTLIENEPTKGKTPRNFFIDPTGHYLLAENQSTDTIVVFRIDQESGELNPTGHVAEVPSPVCIRMLPAG